MKTLSYIVFIFVLFIGSASCQHGSERFRQKYTGIDPALYPYLNDFMNKSNGLIKQENVKNLTMGFDKLNGNIVGLCYTFWDGSKEIAIDTDYYNDSSPLKRMQLIFHELTHCACNRGHTHKYGKYQSFDEEFNATLTNKKNGYFNDFCPNSIMHPETLNEECISKHSDFYMKEMFDKCIVDTP